MATNSLDFLLNLKANTTGFDQGINGAKFAVNALVGAMATLGVGLGVKELAEAADSYANLSARIRLATKDTGDFKSAIAGVHQIALITNSSLDSTAELFSKLNTVAKDMGMSQQQALDLTKTVTQAIKLGGGSVQGAEAAVQQFIQAMQGGVLRGEEFNSMMENGYGLAEALAKGLGVTTGELRKMAENGELGAERVLKALEGQKAAIEASYAQLPNTISNALQKIATSWQIVIGEMDQANGASAQVAEWLSVLAGNLDIVEVLLNDIGDGFVWFGDQLKKIDPQTIEALKTALLSAYDAIKSLGTTLGTVFESTVDVLNTTLGQIFNFSSGIDSASDKTNGFTKALQAVNVVFGFLNDGFKAINIGINLIIGAAYDAASAFSYWKSQITFGDTSEQALKDFELLSAKAQEYYKKSSDGAMAFKSAGVEAIRQIGLTQAEKNAESLANNEKTLAELNAQEAKHNADYKALSEEKIRLNQQLSDAKKASDQTAIDAAMAGLNELQKREQAFQSESEKLTEAKILAAQAVADATIKSADAAGQAALKALNAQLSAQGLKAEFDSAGKVIVAAMELAVKETENLGTTAEQSATKVRKAASALDIDLDAVLNRVSSKFKESERSVNDLAIELENTGVTGQEAAEVIYLGWSKWLATAKSQAEIDTAKAKLQEFQEQGVISTKQVEMGMLAIKQVTAKLPDDLDEVGKAFDRLGIKTKEQLKLAAQSAVADFNTIKASGQATSEGLKQAYERVMQAAAASGDQAVIANAKAQGASVGLQAQIDETGKSSVKSTQEIVDGLYSVGETARGHAALGFRELGRVAREEAQSTADEWTDAMAKIDAERKAQAASSAKGLGQAMDDMNAKVADYEKRLIAAGMSAGEAKSKAQESKDAMYFAYQKALQSGSVIDYSAPLLKKMEDTLNYWEGKKSGSSGSSVSVPIMKAPSVSAPKVPSSADLGNPKTQVYRFEFNGKSIELTGDPSQQDLVNDLFTQLEQAKKRM
ncbi:tape measure protein [Acinetobacter courvalinii]|uniref:Tape measure protein n=1 Tax=Acinetobacter courvalinii TaxID=280147 RepID=A0AA42L8K5_9GAMM|nr:tape measure protein [Acinetobacter courvalinii]MDH0562209.1 tape measure protein [Acinetobacter courvalinii]